MKKDRKNCEEGCLGRITHKEKGIYCKHIEDRLPKPGTHSVKLYTTQYIENFSERKYMTVEYLEKRLVEYGLGPYEVDVIMSRIIEGKSMKQIIAEQKKNKEPTWLSTNSAGYHLKAALKKLRDAGFKP